MKYTNNDDELKRIKDNIECAEKASYQNRLSYKNDQFFVFGSTLTGNDINILSEQNKAALTFNVLKSKIFRLIGEFSKQTPALRVEPSGMAVDAIQENIVDGYIKAIFSGSDYEDIAREVIRETLTGGFSVIKCAPEYKNDGNNANFDQVIRIKKAQDPTKCGFDPMSRQPHRGDGKYCYEVYPKTIEDFQAEYPDADISSFNFFDQENDFVWSYQTGKTKVIMVCDYYEKKTTYLSLVQVVNPLDPQFPLTLEKKKYQQIVKNWKDITPPPKIIKERKSPVTTIVRYILTGNEILESEETDYKYLPFVFVAGDYYYHDGQLITMSYIKEAKDAQRLKNICGSELTNSVEHLRQTDLMIPHAALPRGDTEFLKVYKNPQQAVGALVYEHLDEDGQPVPPPTIQSRGEISQAVMGLYTNMDETIQNILGSYDAQLGIQSNDLSGAAIEAGAMQSNAAAVPFIINFIHSLNQIAKIIVDLLPKYNKTATTIPYLTPENKRISLLINDGRPETTLDYKENDLDVIVKPGTSFAIQQDKALKTMLNFMTASESFKAMMEMKGLPVLIDNLDIKGQDQLKMMAEQFMQEMEQKSEQAAQNPPQDPNMLLAQAEMLKAQAQVKNLEVKQIIEQERIRQKDLEIMQNAAKQKADLILNYQKMEDSNQKNQAEIALRQNDQAIKIAKDMIKDQSELISVDEIDVTPNE